MSPTYDQLQAAIRHGDQATVATIIAEGLPSPPVGQLAPITLAAVADHPHLVHLLWDHATRAERYDALIASVRNHSPRAFAELVEPVIAACQADPLAKLGANYLLLAAVQYNAQFAVRDLVTRLDPDLETGRPLYEAVQNGHLDSVAILAPHTTIAERVMAKLRALIQPSDPAKPVPADTWQGMDALLLTQVLTPPQQADLVALGSPQTLPQWHAFERAQHRHQELAKAPAGPTRPRRRT